MKQIILTVLLLSAGYAVQAQSIERQVIGSAGGSYSGSFQVDWTAGETVTTTASAGSVILTQGFQQPASSTSGVKTVSSSNNVTVYPNPTGATVNVAWTGTSFSGTMELYDANGRLVFTGSETAASKAVIDLSAQAPGIYTLRLTGSDAQVSVHRITRL